MLEINHEEHSGFEPGSHNPICKQKFRRWTLVLAGVVGNELENLFVEKRLRDWP